MESIEIKENIRSKALELGFDDCRFTSATLPQTYRHFLAWIEKKAYAGMDWIASERSLLRRGNVQQILPGAKTIICLATSYFLEKKNENFEKLPRYAWIDDYHSVLKVPLNQLSDYVNTLTNNRDSSVYYTDTGAILERDFAAKSGLGFIGKNNNLISPKFGGFIFLSTIITTLELTPDQSLNITCGSCTKCLESCPTGALTDYFVNANKCLSYLTIEHKGKIPEKFHKFLNKKILGCDQCIEVCPWNKFSTVSNMPGMTPSEKLANILINKKLSIEKIQAMSLGEFKQSFSGTALARPKKDGILRNLTILESNR